MMDKKLLKEIVFEQRESFEVKRKFNSYLELGGFPEVVISHFWVNLTGDFLFT